MHLCLTLRLQPEEISVLVPVMKRHGWLTKETGWVNGEGEQVEFLREQSEIPQWPAADRPAGWIEEVKSG